MKCCQWADWGSITPGAWIHGNGIRTEALQAGGAGEAHSNEETAFRPFYEVTTAEAMSDPNQVYDLKGRLFKFGYLDPDEIERFARTYFKGPLSTADRPRLEGLVRQAVARFEADEDEGWQEEFRQLLKSFNRFYALHCPGHLARRHQLGEIGILWQLAFPLAAKP